MVLMSLQVLLCSFVKVACLVKTAAFLIPPADEIKKKKKGRLGANRRVLSNENPESTVPSFSRLYLRNWDHSYRFKDGCL